MIYLAHQIALYHGVQDTHLHTLQNNSDLYWTTPTDSRLFYALNNIIMHLKIITKYTIKSLQNACFAGVNVLEFVH